MIGHRELTLEDYLVILKRRWRVFIIPGVLGPLVAIGISYLLPEKYISQTLVLVEQQKVPESFVKSVVTDELNDRLGTMREQILSRTRLQPIIERFGLYKKDVGKVAMEDLVDRLRKAIEVTPVRPVVRARNDTLPGFFIGVTASEARTAQQICAEVTSMFMEENLKVREQRAQGTTDFLQKQLAEAKQKLDEQDQRLAAFKQRHVGQLPGQEQTNINLLTGFNTQLAAVTQSLSRAQQDKTYMESLLAQQVAAWNAMKAGTNPETLEDQLAKQKNELVTLEARYTRDHPDVIKARNDVAQLEKKIQEAKNAPGQGTGAEPRGALNEPPQITQLRNQTHQAEVTIKENTREQQRLQETIKIYQARIQLSPIVEQEYKELTRDYETALAFYNDLLSKRNQSEMATDLERRQQGEQFRVMDPPNLPERPSFPNRPMFAGIGLGAGLGLGLALTMVLEMRDKSLRTERDIELFLELPTLALMPMVDSPDSRNKKTAATATADFSV